MSELRSLYVRLKIKKENLERFFQDKPMAAEINEDWTAWWDSRGMYSKSPLTEIPVYKKATNRDVLASLTLDPQSGTTEQQEEDAWGFTVIFFSQNYFDILPMLAWLKSIVHYMEAGDEGVALIYDFFWGSGDVMAHLKFSGQEVSLLPTKKITKIEASIRNAANDTLKAAFDAISAQYGQD